MPDALASLIARLRYVASEHDCCCETPGADHDCAVCEVRDALARYEEESDA